MNSRIATPLSTALILCAALAAGCGLKEPEKGTKWAASTSSSPWPDAGDAPVLTELAYGRVLGSRDYQADFSVGALPAVGRAPGFSANIRLQTGSGSGDCGVSCDLMLATAQADGSAWMVTEPGGHERRFEPDGSGFIEVSLEQGVPLRPATAEVVSGELVVTEHGGKVTRTFDTGGRERQVATPWGNLDLTYDGNGRLTSATNAAGQSLTLAYDGNGRLDTVTDHTGFTMDLVYSGGGELLALEGPADGATTPSIDFTWSSGVVTSVQRLGFDPVQITYAGGKVTGVTNQDGTAYAYRGTENDVEVVDSSDLHVTIAVTDGDVSSVTSSAGTETTYVRDIQGRVTEIRQATSGSDLVTSFTYDANHRVTSVTDPDGNVSSWTYDADGNVTSFTDPRNRTTSYSYDADGNLTSVTDPLDRTATFTYDANGLVTSSSFNGVTTSRTYNARGQVATATDAFGGTATYSYASDGRITGVSKPGYPTVSISRTSSGNGEEVTTTVGSRSTTVTTDFYRRVTSTSTSEGHQRTITHDSLTGLPAGVSSSFRGSTNSTQRTYTNTGDVDTLTVNGQQRQSSARIVPPGWASFE